MKNAMRVLGIVLVILMAASCTTFKFDGAQVNREAPKYTMVGSFDINVKVTELLGSPGGANLLNVTAENMDTPIYEAIQKEITKQGGDAAVNVCIEYKAEFIDFLLSGITFGIYTPATAHITGSVVRY